MGQVFSHEHSACKVTRDGKYLIPDSVSVIPVRENHYQLYAELFEHWSSYTSLTSSKINVNSPIFGLFSEEKQMIKKKQELFTSVARTAFRNKAYEVRQDIISELHPDFKSRVYEIAAYEQNNDTKLAEYYSEMLVNEYGTHYITAVNAGALIVKLDCLSKSYIDKTTAQHIMSAAALTFPLYEQIAKTVNLHLDVASVYSQEHINGYHQNVQKLDIFTMGGAPFTPNFNFSMWLKDIPNNMVTIDRYGKRLHNAISSSLFPELLTATTRKVSRYVEAAIERYIDINEKQMRTQLGSRQQTLIFNQRLGGDDLNQDNGRITKIFGGIYQTCKKAGQRCQQITNTLVGIPGRCPSGYTAIRLFDRIYSEAGNEIFWCGALNSFSVHDKGFLFGGFHSYLRVNPLTGEKFCHPYFDQIELLMSNILSVCLSSDHKNAQAKAVGFGGFFSCKYGNPFALPPDANAADYSSENLPHTCPAGYSQYLMTKFDDCNIHVCLEDDTFDLTRSTLNLPLDQLTANTDIDVEDNTQSSILQVKGSGGTILSRNIEGKWEFSFDSTCQSKVHCSSKYKKAAKKSAGYKILH